VDDIDLRLGRWQDVLSDLDEVDCVITDPPYSPRTEKGQRSAKTKGKGVEPAGYGSESSIHYGAMGALDVARFSEFWAPRVKRWIVFFGDHMTVPQFLACINTHNWVSFAPIVSGDEYSPPTRAWLKTNGCPRFLGDGPSSGVEWIGVARPRRRLRAGEKRYRRPYYLGPRDMEGGFVGRKPEWLMRALIRDYSEVGDLVVDPFAGTGTTLIAASIKGRRVIGAEVDPKTYALASKRLDAGFTPVLPGIV
jgi:hypothetical protein